MSSSERFTNEGGGITYTTRQVADSLRLGPAMIRKYALALEAVTGREIPVKRRDGRQFSREDFDVISKAKALVDSNNGLSVDTALRMVLSGPENGANALAAPGVVGNSTELVEAITAAVAKGNEPLLAELRELRQELREARKTELRQIPPTDVTQIRDTEIDDIPKAEIKPIEPKTFTKLGQRLDRFFNRFKG